MVIVMSHLRIFLIPLILITYSLPSWAVRELVDDFNGSTIDFIKWSNFDPAFSAGEFAARIDTTADNLVLIAASDGSRYQRTRISVLNTSLTALQATISVVSIADGGSTASANIEGRYYNANSVVPVDAIGDVVATVAIGDRGSGLEAWWEIIESTDANFDAWTQLSSGTIIVPGTLSTNTPYIAKVEYYGNHFTFTVDGMSSGPVLGPARMGPADFSYQRLSTSTDCCGTNPSIHATFDDVVLDNLLGIYDDFSSGIHIDSTKWDTYLGSRVTAAGKLVLNVADEDILQDGSANSSLYLKERNPNYVEARISVSNASMLDANIVGRAQLSGYFYNERRDGGVLTLPYDESDGDVWGRVNIVLFNGVLSADAYLQSELTNYDTDQQLLFQKFTKLITFDTEYLVSLKRDGDRIIFGLDDEKIVYTITTPTYPPSPAFSGNGYRKLNSFIGGTSTSSPAGASGIFMMFADDFYVGAPRNIGPTGVALVSPANGASGLGTAVTFIWKTATDPDSNSLSYQIFLCEDPAFAGCTPTVVASTKKVIDYADAEGLLPLVLFGTVLGGFGLRRRKWLMMAIVSLAIIGLVSNCGGGGGGSAPASSTTDEMSHTESGLKPATTYYWKVSVSDGIDTVESATRSFSTQ
jgi:hypothetical protein